MSSIAVTTLRTHHCMCQHAWHVRMHVSICTACMHASCWHAC